MGKAIRWRHFGKFYDEKGNVLDTEPEPDAAFPIRCGAWPNPHDHAIQRICTTCGESIGVSPKGLKYHEMNPTIRPLFCGECFDILVMMMKDMNP